MSDFADWLIGLVRHFFLALWDFALDVLTGAMDIVLTAILGLLQLLPVPGFAGAGALQTIVGQISPDVWYFASHFKLTECFAALGSAVVFRLARKAITLFQW